MKRLLLGVLMLLSIRAFCQDTYSEYGMPALSDSKVFELKATKPNEKGAFDYYIEGYNREGSDNSVYLWITPKRIGVFYEALGQAKRTYAEWSKTAEENNVTELQKAIKTKAVRIKGAFRYGSKFHYDYIVPLSFEFWLTDGKPKLHIYTTDGLQSASNQFIDSDGCSIVFGSVEEVDAFIEEIKPSKVAEHYRDKVDKEDLFKQN